MVTRRKVKSKNRISVDFEGVESGGRSVPDGLYLARPSKVTIEEGQESGEDYLSFRWKIQAGKYRNTTVFDNMSLQPQVLWRLKTLLEALEMEVPDGAMDLDLDELLKAQGCGIEIVNEEYDGKDKPRITGFVHGDAVGGDGGTDIDDEDEEEEDTDGDGDDAEPLNPAEVKKGDEVYVITLGGDEYTGTVKSKTKLKVTIDTEDGPISLKLKEVSFYPADEEAEEEELEEAEEVEELEWADITKGMKISISQDGEEVDEGTVTSKLKLKLTIADDDGEKTVYLKKDGYSFYAVEDEEEEEEDEEEETSPPKKTSTRKRTGGKNGDSKFRLGSKVKFRDEDNKLVRGVIVDLEDDMASIEDAQSDVWSVEVSELS